MTILLTRSGHRSGNSRNAIFCSVTASCFLMAGSEKQMASMMLLRMNALSSSPRIITGSFPVTCCGGAGLLDGTAAPGGGVDEGEGVVAGVGGSCPQPRTATVLNEMEAAWRTAIGSDVLVMTRRRAPENPGRGYIL